MFLSTISITEILSFKKFTLEEKKGAEKFLNENFTIVAFSNEIAKTAADLRVTYGLKLPDAAIAATAINLKLPLLSRDRDFRRVKELTLLEI